MDCGLEKWWKAFHTEEFGQFECVCWGMGGDRARLGMNTLSRVKVLQEDPGESGVTGRLTSLREIALLVKCSGRIRLWGGGINARSGSWYSILFLQLK